MNWNLTSSTIVIVFLLAEYRYFHAQKVTCHASEASVLQLPCCKAQWNFTRLVMDEGGVAKPQALVRTQEAVDQGGLLAR